MHCDRVICFGGVGLLALTLTGCGMRQGVAAGASAPAPVSSAKQGTVSGGEQPVSGAAIQLFAVGTTGDGSPATALLKSPVTTDTAGTFTITGLYTCPSASTLVYLTATGGDPGSGHSNPALALMSALGSCGSLNASSFLYVDERTTVSAVAALMPFMRAPDAVGSSGVDGSPFNGAFALANMLVDTSTGQVPGPMLPANSTVPVATVNSLANVLAACVNSAGGVAGDGSACGRLFASATPAGGVAPTNTVWALLNLMRDPAKDVGVVFGVTAAAAPFQPALSAAPADWSLSISGQGAPASIPYGCSAPDLTGSNVFTDYTKEQPQVCRLITAADLPKPSTADSTANYAVQVSRAAGQMPVVPPGFQVTLYASGFGNARYLLAAANGDLLLSQPGSGTITVLRGVDSKGAALNQYTYARGLTSPYGMAFYPSAAKPQYLYVANTSTLVRFPYALGDTVASAAPTTLATDIPNSGNHTTRALVFTQEPTPRLLVSVGSASNFTNTDTDSAEYHRADILAYSVEGVFQSIYASGLRNPVGLVLDANGRPWTSVNERDGLGDNLPSDYVTHVQEGGFYGWPWYYNGPNPEPRLPDSHPELAAKTLVADTLLQAHFAPLQINFYTGSQFPMPYQGSLFVASHGSWNKAVRGGYEVLRVPVANGNATGDFEDFMTGFVNPDGSVWGRPAGVAMGADGALYVADDASNSIWRVTYTGQ